MLDTLIMNFSIWLYCFQGAQRDSMLWHTFGEPRIFSLHSFSAVRLLSYLKFIIEFHYMALHTHLYSLVDVLMCVCLLFSFFSAPDNMNLPNFNDFDLVDFEFAAC